MSAQPDTYVPPAHGWTCFHCGDTFTDERSARAHFGPTPAHEPGCILKFQAGDRSLLRALRVVEAERDELRRQHCEEDSELHRALHAKDAEMHAAVRRAEEQGYARGLEDAKKYPETLGLTRASPGEPDDAA